MKYILPIVLLYTTQYASADTTLTFMDAQFKDSQHVITYNIKENRLKLAETGSDRINIFNQSTQQFISFDPKTDKTSMINEAVLNQRVTQFKQKRIKKVSEVEKKLEEKLKTMSKKEQEVGQSMLNVLKYPELYGAHTQLRVNSISKTKQVAKIECKTYLLYRKEQLLKEYCFADAKALNINAQEYQTIRGFYAFDYNMQTRLMLALGESDFSLIDFEKEKIPGIVIETISYKGQDITQHLLLNSFSSDKLADSIFDFKTKAPIAP
ncbi:hypothetical protein MNBD_GAMMA09-3714 [hydrothermal vent metagenome]|uniref:DUF4412 domain-containing protein n=1 Tax=hydrothermal vent metagenome TaxID=652676 RepID=A0A3B0XLB1_9ZZZZ